MLSLQCYQSSFTSKVIACVYHPWPDLTTRSSYVFYTRQFSCTWSPTAYDDLDLGTVCRILISLVYSFMLQNTVKNGMSYSDRNKRLFYVHSMRDFYVHLHVFAFSSHVFFYQKPIGFPAVGFLLEPSQCHWKVCTKFL